MAKSEHVTPLEKSVLALAEGLQQIQVLYIYIYIIILLYYILYIYMTPIEKSVLALAEGLQQIQVLPHLGLRV